MQRAVTLVEMLAAVVIVAILSITIFFSLSGSTEDAQDAWVLDQQKKLQAQLKMVYTRAYQESVMLPGEEGAEEVWHALVPREKAGLAIHSPFEDVAVRAPATTAFEARLPQNLRPTFQSRLYMLVQTEIDSKYTTEGFGAVLNHAGLMAIYLSADDPMIQAGVASQKMPVLLDVASIVSHAGTVDATALSGTYGSGSWDTGNTLETIPLGALPESSKDWLQSLIVLDLDPGTGVISYGD